MRQYWWILGGCAAAVVVVAACSRPNGSPGSGVGGGGSSPPPDASPPASDAGALDAAEGGACYRDPYLPDVYKPPCDQPAAKPNCKDGWCVIEPGCFIMGSPWCEWGRAKDSENPVQVTLTHRFRIQQLELTQAQWTALGLPNPSGLAPNGMGDCSAPECPVGNMTWMEALAFANLMSQHDNLLPCYELFDCVGELGKRMICDGARTVGPLYDCKGYRLPTGAEWEYAARAGTKTSVYSGDIIQRALPYTCVDDPVLSPIAWYCANGGNYTHPGGQLQPNGWGLYDMIGNAYEWGGSLATGGYGDGPYVDWGATWEVHGCSGFHPTSLIQTRGGAFSLWPQILRAGGAGGDPIGGGPGMGLRLAQTVTF